MAFALRLLPALRGLSIVRAFAGLRPHSDSGEPVVRRLGAPQGLIIAAGHGGDGVALAPVTGQIVASLAAGGAPEAAEQACQRNGAEMQI